MSLCEKFRRRLEMRGRFAVTLSLLLHAILIWVLICWSRAHRDLKQPILSQIELIEPPPAKFRGRHSGGPGAGTHASSNVSLQTKASAKVTSSSQAKTRATTTSKMTSKMTSKTTSKMTMKTTVTSKAVARPSEGQSVEVPSTFSDQKVLGLANLLPKIGDRAALERDSVANGESHSHGEEGGWGGTPADDNPSAGWGDGAAEFKRVEDYGLMHKIYERTDDALFYPAVLAAHQISGTVKARLVFTSAGACDWGATTIQSSDPHLRIYILSLLKGVCHQNYAKFLRGRKSTNVDFFFDFAVTEHNDLAIADSHRMVIGNVLAFYRNSQHSIGEWHLGPFQGMFPIPMVSMDFGWLTENLDRVMNQRDPFKEQDKEFIN